MVQSKAWDWKLVQKAGGAKRWLEPAIESYWLTNRWLGQGKHDFLDLGCGLGRHSIMFAQAGFKVSAFDLSEEALAKTGEYAKEAGVEVVLKHGDMLNLPYDDASFDCIYCRNVISHTDTAGIKKIIAELRRVLRPGGECYLTLCSKQSWGFQQNWPMVDENTKIRDLDGPEKGVPHFYADYDLAKILFSDFEIVEIYHLEDFFTTEDGKTNSSYHYHLLIKK